MKLFFSIHIKANKTTWPYFCYSIVRCFDFLLQASADLKASTDSDKDSNDIEETTEDQELEQEDSENESEEGSVHVLFFMSVIVIVVVV